MGRRPEANDLYSQRAMILHGDSSKSNLRKYNKDKLLLLLHYTKQALIICKTRCNYYYIPARQTENGVHILQLPCELALNV